MNESDFRKKPFPKNYRCEIKSVKPLDLDIIWYHHQDTFAPTEEIPTCIQCMGTGKKNGEDCVWCGGKGQAYG